MIFRLQILMMAALMLIAGCSGVPRRARMTPLEVEKADYLASKAALVNIGLESFKGKGRITLSDGRIVRSARVFWIGSKDGGLRLQTLGVSGRPDVSIAGDGDCFYFFSHLDRRFQKKCSSDPNLENFLGVSVRFSEIESLLYGRAPVRDHDTVFYEQDDDGHVLGFENRWGRCVQRIGFSEDMETIRWSEVYGSNRKRVYRVEFRNRRTVDGFSIPFYIGLFNDDGAGFKLEIERYWPNADTSSTSFFLEPVSADD